MARNSGNKSRFTYKRRSYEDARKRAEQAGGSRDSYINEEIQLYKPSEGENLIRILPPSWEEPDHYGIDIYVHYGVGPDNAAYLCRQKMLGEACPICEERANAEAAGDKDYAKKLKPTKRVLFYLVDRDKESEGVRAWASPWTVDKEIAIQATDSRTKEFFPVDDPDEGYDVKIARTGQGERTEYSVSIARRPSTIDITQDIEDVLVDKPLPNVLQYYDYSYIKGIFEGTAPATSTKKVEEEEAQEEEPTPSRSRSTRTSRKEESKNEWTWDDIQKLEGEKIDKFILDNDLNLDPNEFETDEELIEAICEEMGLNPPDTKEEEEEEEPPFEADEKEEETTKKSNIQDRLAALRNRRQR